MSEAGLLIHNNDGDLLINSTYKNLYLVRKLKLTSMSQEVLSNGTLTFSSNVQTNEVIAPIARTNGNPLTAFCFRGASKWVIYAPKSSNSQTTAQLLADLDNVYVYIFGVRTGTSATGNVGLQVFNQSGVCVYNSNDKPMRVLHYANNVGNANVNNTALDSYTVPSGKTCAVFNCSIVNLSMGQGQARPTYFCNAYHSDNGKIMQQATIMGVAPITVTMGDYIGYMVVDVTGY